MSHFQESAVRDSTGQSPHLSLPYWIPNNQISALIEATYMTGNDLTANDQYTHASALAGFSDESISVPSEFDLLNSQRPIPYSHFGDYAPASPAILQRPGRNTSLTSPINPMSPPIAVRTPTGPRTLRRPGLAGASATVNGHFCCQWSLNGLTCGRLYSDAKQLNDHIKADHVRGAQKFICQWKGCDKDAFPTANKLVRHVHSHTGYKPFQCQLCLQSFVTKDQLDKHSTTHTGAKDFVCNWEGCGRSFAVKHALDGHVNSVHLKAKKHTCPHCGQAFDDSSNLSKHKKQVHNQETGIKCPARHTHDCCYVDSRKDKLREHCEREQHGLEIVNDAHRWNMWVQQFKSSVRRSECRRHHRHASTSTMSRASSVSTSTYASGPHSTNMLPIGCDRRDCSLPVCLPCNMLCSDLHPATLHHPLAQTCHEPDCGAGEACQPCEPCEPCEPCDPCEPCEPCETCDGTDCDPTTREPCGGVGPCDESHCGSVSPTPSRALSPAYGHDCMPSETYFNLASFPEADHDPLHGAGSSFPLERSRTPDIFRL